jgi:hypothetical protein
LALRAALRTRCAADATLASLMGGAAEIHDEPPRRAEPVYAVFGDAVCRDWSTSGDRGHESEFALVVWARPGSAASALAAAARLAELVEAPGLALVGHRLVQIAVVATETARERASLLVNVTLRMRATTEVA